MTPIFDWYPQTQSWTDKVRVRWASMEAWANNAVLILLLLAWTVTVLSFGHVLGVRSKAACPPPSKSVDVLSYRDPKTGVIVCELTVAKYYVPGMRDQ